MKKIYRFYLPFTEQQLHSSDSMLESIRDHMDIGKFDSDLKKGTVLWAWTTERAMAKRYLNEHPGIFELKKETTDSSIDFYKKTNMSDYKLGIYPLPNANNGYIEVLCTEYEHDWIIFHATEIIEERSRECTQYDYRVFNSSIIRLLAELGYTNCFDSVWNEDETDRETAIYNSSFGLDKNGLPSGDLEANRFNLYVERFSFLFP